METMDKTGTSSGSGTTVQEPSTSSNYIDESLYSEYEQVTEKPIGMAEEIMAEGSVNRENQQDSDGDECTEPVESSNSEDDDNSDEDLSVKVERLSKELAELKRQMEVITHKLAAYPKGVPEASDSDNSESKLKTHGKPKKSVKAKIVSIVGSILFYAVILGLIVGAFLLRSASEGRPFQIAGYSSATILTSSMEDTYPKGSLIITKHVKFGELKKGDDITFMRNENSTVTHRIVEVIDNYSGTGKPAYVTKGTMNKDIDKWDPVAYDNVVGKVIFCSSFLGSFAGFVKNNWPLLIFIMAVLLVFSSVMKWIFREDSSEDSKAKAKDSADSNETDESSEHGKHRAHKNQKTKKRKKEEEENGEIK